MSTGMTLVSGSPGIHPQACLSWSLYSPHPMPLGSTPGPIGYCPQGPHSPVRTESQAASYHKAE